MAAARRPAASVPGSSYASHSELRARFGLGAQNAVESLVVTWPNGVREQFAVEGVDRVVAVVEGEGQPVAKN